MISSIVSRLVILVFGTLYPAYASYKAVRTKNVKEYVKWMMYWIVFALFTCAETFTDVFLSFWFPFYYEIKIILVLWLLSPATKGSSILYRKFVHPMLSRREQEIDEYIAKAKEQGYHTVLHLGTKGVNYATTVLMQTAIKGGGGLVNQLRRSYSLSDLSSDKETEMRSKNVPDEDDMEETDGLDPRMLRPRGYSPRRSASGSGRVEMYFPEVDVDVRQHSSSRPREPSIPLSHIRSSEDVSSGYSSAEPLYAGHHSTKSEGLAASREPLVRTASVGSTRSMRTKSSRGGVVTKRGPAVEDSDFFEAQSDEAVHTNQEAFKYPPSPPLIASTQEQSVDASGTETQSNDLYVSASAMHDLTNSAPHPCTPVPTNNIQRLNTPSSPEEQLSLALISLSDSEQSEKQPQIQLSSVVEQTISDKQHQIQFSSAVEKPLDEKQSQIQLSSVVEKSSAEKQPQIPLSSAVDQSLDQNQSEIQLPSVVDKSSAEKQPQIPLSSAVQQSFDGEQHQIQISSVEDQSSDEKQSQIHSSSVVKQFSAEKQPEIPSASVVEQSFDGKQLQIQLSSAENQSLNDKQSQMQLSSVVEQSSHEKPSQIAVDKSLDEKQPEITSSSAVEKSLDKKQHEIPSSSAVEQSLDEKQPEIPSSSAMEQFLDEKQSQILSSSAEKQPEIPLSSAAEISWDEKKSQLLLSSTETLAGRMNAVTMPEDGKHNESSSTYESSESLAALETPSRSNSQSSLRKEGRAGRYHKHPAPRTPEPEHSQSVTPTLSEGSDDSEAAITTARLVLKPGVVRSLGPDENSKTEVFVSKTAEARNRKSKAKKKQGDSNISRLFAIPRNQFGSLTSLLPFWHGKQEPSPSGEVRAPLADME